MVDGSAGSSPPFQRAVAQTHSGLHQLGLLLLTFSLAYNYTLTFELIISGQIDGYADMLLGLDLRQG